MDEKKIQIHKMYTVLKGKVALTQKESKPKIYKRKEKNERVS
jgi:hypothetical protein